MGMTQDDWWVVKCTIRHEQRAARLAGRLGFAHPPICRELPEWPDDDDAELHDVVEHVVLAPPEGQETLFKFLRWPPIIEISATLTVERPRQHFGIERPRADGPLPEFWNRPREFTRYAARLRRTLAR